MSPPISTTMAATSPILVLECIVSPSAAGTPTPAKRAFRRRYRNSFPNNRRSLTPSSGQSDELLRASPQLRCQLVVARLLRQLLVGEFAADEVAPIDSLERGIGRHEQRSAGALHRGAEERT